MHSHGQNFLAPSSAPVIKRLFQMFPLPSPSKWMQLFLVESLPHLISIYFMAIVTLRLFLYSGLMISLPDCKLFLKAVYDLCSFHSL